jgi:hypothetical protein
VAGGDSAQFEFTPRKLYRQHLAHVGGAHPVAMVRGLRLQQNVAMRESGLLTPIGNGTGRETPVMLGIAAMWICQNMEWAIVLLLLHFTEGFGIRNSTGGDHRRTSFLFDPISQRHGGEGMGRIKSLYAPNDTSQSTQILVFNCL